MIRLHGVYKHYPPDQVALQKIDLTINDGDFVFIAGASGAGKSTLLRLLSAAERPSGGQVIVNGRNLERINAVGIADLRRSIGTVFQDYKLLENLTVLENVGVGLEVQGVSARGRGRLARLLLRALDLESRAEAFPRMLSGGEQQRVAMARALLHHPRLILADEPTGNLDADMARTVFELLLEANAAGVTVVVATHDLAMIENLNLRTVVLDRGRVLGDFERPRGLE